MAMLARGLHNRDRTTPHSVCTYKHQTHTEKLRAGEREKHTIHTASSTQYSADRADGTEQCNSTESSAASTQSSAAAHGKAATAVRQRAFLPCNSRGRARPCAHLRRCTFLRWSRFNSRPGVATTASTPRKSSDSNFGSDPTTAPPSTRHDRICLPSAPAAGGCASSRSRSC